MKVDTDVLLSAYTGWVMTNNGLDEVKKVFEYLEDCTVTDLEMNTAFKKWSSYLGEKYNLSKYFEGYIMPNEMNKIVEMAYKQLGDSVDLIK